MSLAIKFKPDIHLNLYVRDWLEGKAIVNGWQTLSVGEVVDVADIVFMPYRGVVDAVVQIQFGDKEFFIFGEQIDEAVSKMCQEWRSATSRKAESEARLLHDAIYARILKRVGGKPWLVACTVPQVQKQNAAV